MAADGLMTKGAKASEAMHGLTIGPVIIKLNRASIQPSIMTMQILHVTSIIIVRSHER